MSEEWRPVQGWPYEVSTLGRVRVTETRQGTTAGSLISLSPNADGYMRFTMMRGGKRRSVGVHQLVLGAFVGPVPTSRHEPNHKDGVPGNNRLDNLEWATRRENIAHAVGLGLCPHMTKGCPPPKRGEDVAVSRLTTDEVVRIRRRWASKESGIRPMAREYDVSPSVIWKIVHRVAWSHVP